MADPVICFGQQPCGFFPKRFLVSKIDSARKLQRKLGGRIVFFCHDSDHDYRETCTIITNRKTGRETRMNFDAPNKIQKRYSPLYAKRISEEWFVRSCRQLPVYVSCGLVEIFKSVRARNYADFCLEMYTKMGLLDEIEVVRSGDPDVRQRAVEVADFFVDTEYEGEIVRARYHCDGLFLHPGGSANIRLPDCDIRPEMVSPTRDTRLRWMQSVVHCTHYVAGEGEIQYMNCHEAPEVEFVVRDPISSASLAFVGV